MLPNDDFFMSMLKDKESVIRTILSDLEASDKNMQAFAQLEHLLSEGEAVSADKVHRAAAKSLRHLNEVNKRLLLILLTYVSGGDFGTDAAKVLLKMGRGQEALQEMMRQKMQGRD